MEIILGESYTDAESGRLCADVKNDATALKEALGLDEVPSKVFGWHIEAARRAGAKQEGVDIPVAVEVKKPQPQPQPKQEQVQQKK
jgi:hypothetical protein